MRLGQILWQRAVTAAIFNGEYAKRVAGHTLRELLSRSEQEGVPLAELARRLTEGREKPWVPQAPILPKKVVAWKQAPEILEPSATTECIGTGQAFYVHRGTKLTPPAPQLALVMGCKGKIIGYTLASHLRGSQRWSLGPVMVTSDDVKDPYSIEVTCTIERERKIYYFGSVNTKSLKVKFEDMVKAALAKQPVASGSVLLTHFGVPVPDECVVHPGDIVRISGSGIGELANPIEISYS